MKRVLIGHRGVGKSSLLKRHSIYFADVPHFDLDAEIEKKMKMSIQDFFSKFSETEFRQIEDEVYQNISSQNKNFVIALGAGFNLEKINSTHEIIFVSRRTDRDGRIFLNRPRLQPELTPLDEARARFRLRQPQYIKNAHFIYDLSEGLEACDPIEEKILRSDYKILDAYYTLTSSEISEIPKRIKNFSKIELRTDLMTQPQIQTILKDYPDHNWLVSFRNTVQMPIPEATEVDFDIQFLPSQVPNNAIISTHANSLDQALREIKPYQDRYQIKLCPLIANFDELRKAHLWQAQDPERKSFLPRSETGKWIWYRLLLKYQQKINFIRNMTESLDQPSIYEWMNLPETKPSAWAAVLGSPIYFSRSPLQHQNYFKERKTFMCAIEASVDDFEKNLAWLQQLGLRFLAVTSPLKERAYQISTHPTERATELKSANTLFLDEEKKYAHNTDFDGFMKMLSELDTHEDTAVWGGGGTLEMMQKALPEATYFSSQTGEPRDLQKNKKNFATLIWAAPRKPTTLFPTRLEGLQRLIDLNYTDDSMGLEFAQKMILKSPGFRYVSGLEMFRQQALKQQEFWSSQ